MAADWIELAIEMITEYGRAEPIEFTRIRYGDYNPVLQEREVLETPSYTCLGAPIDFNFKDIDNVNIVSGQKMLYIPAVDVNGAAVYPQIGDTLVLEKAFRVLEVNTYETQSTDCAFLLKIGV